MPRMLSDKKNIPYRSRFQGAHNPCRVALGCLFVAAALFFGCGKGEKAGTVIVIGTDTVKIEMARLLVPDATDDSGIVERAVRRRLLAKALPLEEKPTAPVSAKLAQKLALISGTDYSPQEAELLLKAATVIDSALRNGKSVDSVIAFFDSICSAFPVSANGKPVDFRLTSKERARFEAFNLTDEKQQLELLASLLGLSGEAAATLVSFIAPQDKGAAVDVMVKGLIAEPNVRPKPMPAKKKIAPDPSMALAFRSRESIRDSIARHLTNLQQLYKRQLKTGDVASGTVWVTFEVNAEGRVIAARIRKSEINNMQFLERLGQYARLIKFEQIPETVGSMTFEFPFEFKPEEF
jgi:TonB family protein